MHTYTARNNTMQYQKNLTKPTRAYLQSTATERLAGFLAASSGALREMLAASYLVFICFRRVAAACQAPADAPGRLLVPHPRHCTAGRCWSCL